MKPLLSGLGLLILFMMFFSFQKENNQLIQELKIAKYLADECASSGSLYYDIEKYGTGKIIYNQQECIKAIENILLKENSNYWESITYDVFFFDDDCISFPYRFKDPYRNYIKLITEPTVIVILKIYKNDFIFDFLKDKMFYINSAYENLEY